MYALGISALSHDAAVSVVDTVSKEIVFAAHAERYSGIKNDRFLSEGILKEAMQYHIDKVYWHGNPWLKSTRELFAGEDITCFKQNPKKYLRSLGIDLPLSYVGHHKSHAAAGYYTSTYTDAAIVVVDAIGEWDTVTIWHGKGENITKLVSIKYPSSIGLMYSAFTQRLGLKPNEEEYIMMGMAAYGKPETHYVEILNDFIGRKSVLGGYQIPTVLRNCHRGIGEYLPGAKDVDLAASAQMVLERVVREIFELAQYLTGSGNLVYQGGVALNCVANRSAYFYFDNVWVMPNPGDAGGSLGAIAASVGRLKWETPYLGHNISGEYPVTDALALLERGEIFGIATGRAEFGPRAFGNRSLVADPRGPHVKDKVNAIKKRQEFRPFAPMIMEEMVSEYFDVPTTELPYMQLTVPCKFPDKFPAIVHVDGSSRVQTVRESDNPGLHNLLSEFYKKTGCPMLLNTSLNIKGSPLVNNLQDAHRFSAHYGVPVIS